MNRIIKSLNKSVDENSVAILHHTSSSIFAEKIRLLLDYTETRWLSVEATTNTCGRDIQEILVQGYSRRIPLLQVGADIYCDSSVITTEISNFSKIDALNKGKVKKEIRDYFIHCETDVFMAMMGSFKMNQIFSGYVKNIGLKDTFSWAYGRGKAIKSATKKPEMMNINDSRKARELFLNDLEEKLSLSNYLFSNDKPTIADFSAYQFIWYNLRMKVMKDFSFRLNIEKWYKRMHSFRINNEISNEAYDSIKIAKNNRPKVIPDHLKMSSRIGDEISLKPNDFGKDITPPIRGVLVGEDENKYIISRETKETGILHVHFPKRALGACM